MVSRGEKRFSVFTLAVLVQVALRTVFADPTFPICPGTCIDRRAACNNVIDPTHCGSMSICCLDNFELTTEQGFDFNTLQSVSDDQWISEVDSDQFNQVNPAAEVFEVDSFESTENPDLFTTAPPNEQVFFTTEDQGLEEVFTTAAPHENTFFKFESAENEDDRNQFFTVMPQDESLNTVPSQDFYTEIEPNQVHEVVKLDHCPGACIPTQHSSLCHYAMQSNLCPPGKTCCATKAAAQALNLQKSPESHMEQDYHVSQCPGRCVHPSLSMYCNNVLDGYSCPMESTCCDSEVVQSSPIVHCSGECLPPQSTYLCLPPYQLIPGTNCESSTVCCMQTLTDNEQDETNKAHISDTYSTENSQDEPTGFASDEHGQLYYVYQNGQFQPLPMISVDDTLDPSLTHFGDVEVATGKASLFKDNTGAIYQLSVIQPPQDFNVPRMGFVDQNTNFDQEYNPHVGHDFQHSISGNSYENMGQPRFSSTQNFDLPPRREEPKTVFSSPDDVDDIEENLKDVILPDENENMLVHEKSNIPPGERTLVKPKCPGSCLTSFLRFTCIGNHKIYDGFTCTPDTACCASISDIEEHEQYLETLSPFFNAPVENNENANTCSNNWPKNFHSEEKLIADYCWQVAIINPLNQYICGGALIHDSWVLTAAHCVTGALKENKPLYVRAGVNDLTSTSDSSAGQTRRALSIFVHHKHNSMSLDNDIAILRLQTPLQLNVNVCISCLPTTEAMPQNDSDCVVSGYGFLSKAGTMSLKLDDARISLIDDMDCIANVTDALSTVFILPSSGFCASGLRNNEACQGDAGAPLMCENNGRQELTGLVSWSLGCGKAEVPSIYVKIPMFMSWINQIMSASSFLKALH